MEINANAPIDFLNKTIRETSEMGTINTNEISDGFHTFGELYKHRIHLFIALCNQLQKSMKFNTGSGKIIKSKLHSDGSEFEGWFIVQLETPYGQISYHLPNEYWDRCDFIETKEKANEWDGHESNDVLERLLKI